MCMQKATFLFWQYMIYINFTEYNMINMKF